MLWLEMSRAEDHGGPGWGFMECLWSPARKENGSRWPYWDCVRRVRAGDLVLHLRGKTHKAYFNGYSVAAADGQETRERPPSPGDWGFAKTFHRVFLRDAVQFADPIKLDDVFGQQRAALEDYFKRNKAVPSKRRERLFYVLQAGRLQCLNGAYLSEVSDELAGLLLGPDFAGHAGGRRPAAISAKTAEQIATIKARVGQDVFSDNVRHNYGRRCCFPECDIAEDTFLIGAHIARWTDAPEMRGDTANGLCLCLFHDKAFELGMFTLTQDGRVWVSAERARMSPWAAARLLPHSGKRIRAGDVAPSLAALQHHWKRTGCRPEG